MCGSRELKLQIFLEDNVEKNAIDVFQKVCVSTLRCLKDCNMHNGWTFHFKTLYIHAQMIHCLTIIMPKNN